MTAETAPALLALDAATEGCSAAVTVGEAVRASRFERLQRGHAERLMPMIEAVMDEAGLDYCALDAIAVTVGPGSFTGVRVGLSTARGLALAGGLPLIGVTTLEALAAAVPEAERAGARILAALDALRGQVYAQWFDASGAPLSPPMAVAAGVAVAAFDVSGTILVGSGASAIRDALGPDAALVRRSRAPDWPDAATIARIVATRGARAGGVRALAQCAVRPLYLREPGARSSDQIAKAGRS